MKEYTIEDRNNAIAEIKRTMSPSQIQTAYSKACADEAKANHAATGKEKGSTEMIAAINAVRATAHLYAAMV